MRIHLLIDLLLEETTAVSPNSRAATHANYERRIMPQTRALSTAALIMAETFEMRISKILGRREIKLACQNFVDHQVAIAKGPNPREET